ncbi:MAG: hypothetical protein K2X34_02215 [Hyphomonadaceae bacterium]|nr:hypothetical protein [Hyphomonadaceae bacterium]
MSGLDFVKALGVALLLMVLNVAASFGVMALYSSFIEPGHDISFYESAARDIAPWSSVFVGGLLFFLAGWFFAGRRPQRNAVHFALAFALIYIVLDVGIIVMVDSRALMTMAGLVVVLSVVTKLAASVAGAMIGRKT